MLQIKKIAWLGSLLLHTALVALLYGPIPEKASREVVEFEILKAVPQAASRTTSQRQQIANAGSAGSGASSNSRYFPQYTFEPGGALESNGDTYSVTPGRDNPKAEWGSGGGSFARISEMTFFQHLYEKIDGVLYYPGVLARNDIEGTVNARLVILSSGECDWKKTLIQGHQPYLELYVLDILKKTCKHNFRSFVKNREITNADLTFAFDINETSDHEQIQKQKFIVGNVLAFYRNAAISKLEWELGPFHGMFPVPAVYLNIPWIQENWDKLQGKEHPLIEFKRRFGEG